MRLRLVSHWWWALTRSLLGRACALYAERFADAEGRVAATFEIITLTGWGPREAGALQPAVRDII